LCGFSLSSYHQHRLKALLLLYPMCLLKDTRILNCEQNFSFVIFRSGISDMRISEGLLYGNICATEHTGLKAITLGLHYEGYHFESLPGNGRAVPVLNQLSTMPWRSMGGRIYSSTFSWPRHYWKWVVSFTPGERAPGTHWIGGWVNPRAGVDYLEKRKFLSLPGLELRPLSHRARRESLYRLRYPGSYLYRDMSYVFFVAFLSPSGILPQLWHNRFLPDPFQFISHVTILLYIWSWQ
jgi:hypothetical protein